MFTKQRNFSGMLLLAGILSSLTIASVPESAQAQYVAVISADSTTDVTLNAAKNQKAATDLRTPTDLKAPKKDIPGDDASVIQGVNTAGTVRVNNLAMLESLVNIGANGTEIFGICWGVSILFAAFKTVQQNKRRHLALFSLAPIIAGIASPSAWNWLIATARDANLFQ